MTAHIKSLQFFLVRVQLPQFPHTVQQPAIVRTLRSAVSKRSQTPFSRQQMFAHSVKQSLGIYKNITLNFIRNTMRLAKIAALRDLEHPLRGSGVMKCCEMDAICSRKQRWRRRGYICHDVRATDANESTRFMPKTYYLPKICDQNTTTRHSSEWMKTTEYILHHNLSCDNLEKILQWGTKPQYIMDA